MIFGLTKMKKINYKRIAGKVIELQIIALKKLKKSFNNSFNQTVDELNQETESLINEIEKWQT